MTLVLNAGGNPFTHSGSDTTPGWPQSATPVAAHSWGTNTGIRVLHLRKDGFVAVVARA